MSESLEIKVLLIVTLIATFIGVIEMLPVMEIVVSVLIVNALWMAVMVMADILKGVE